MARMKDESERQMMTDSTAYSFEGGIRLTSPYNKSDWLERFGILQNLTITYQNGVPTLIPFHYPSRKKLTMFLKSDEISDDMFRRVVQIYYTLTQDPLFKMFLSYFKMKSYIL